MVHSFANQMQTKNGVKALMIIEKAQAETQVGWAKALTKKRALQVILSPVAYLLAVKQ